MNTLRQFSTSARVCRFISNIGNQPITIPPNVALTPSSTSLAVKGLLGETTVPLEPYVRLSFPQPDTLSLTVKDGAVKHQRAMWGTTRSLIDNAITEMSSGVSKPLYLVGIGYRAALEDDPRGTVAGGNGKRLNLKLGHSHNIFVPIPAHITAEPPRLWLAARTTSLWATFLPKFEDYVPLSHTRERVFSSAMRRYA